MPRRGLPRWGAGHMPCMWKLRDMGFFSPLAQWWRGSGKYRSSHRVVEVWFQSWRSFSS